MNPGGPNFPPMSLPSGFHAVVQDVQQQPLEPASPGIVKKLAALAFNTGEAFVTVAASWGLRRVLMAGFTQTSVALVNAYRAEQGLKPLEANLVANAAFQALLAAASSTAAAPVLGAVHGMALNVTQFLRDILNWADMPDDPTSRDVRLNNITNPRLRLLADKLVTAGFSLLTVAVGVQTIVAGKDYPSNMQSGQVSGGSSFNSHPVALGSAIVGGGAFLVGSLITWFKDGDLLLGAPKPLTLKGAQNRVEMRSLAATKAFTAPLFGNRFYLTVPLVLGVGGATGVLTKAYQDDMHPYAAGFLNGSIAGLAFLTIAHQWGTMKIRYELAPSVIKSSVDSSTPDQKAEWVKYQHDHEQNQVQKWTQPSNRAWVADQIVQTGHAMLSGMMVTIYTSTMASDHVGISQHEFARSAREDSSWNHLLPKAAVVFAGGSLIVYCMNKLSPASTAKTPPPEVIAKLDEKGLVPGNDKDQAWADGMMPSLVGGAFVGGIAAVAGLPLATAVGLSAFSTLITRVDPIGLVLKAYDRLRGRQHGPVPAPLNDDIVLRDFDHDGDDKKGIAQDGP